MDRLELAAAQLCACHPDDGPAIDRLFRYLENNRPLLADIKAAVVDLYTIDVSELVGGGRAAEVAFARAMFCYIARRYTKNSLRTIGLHVGLTDHTSVRHNVRKIEKQAVTRPLVADDISLLELKISERMLERRRHSC